MGQLIRAAIIAWTMAGLSMAASMAIWGTDDNPRLAAAFTEPTLPVFAAAADDAASAGDKWRELDWSKYLAEQLDGEAEHRLPDGARVDVLQRTTSHTITWEVEWVDKWPESIGQALFYSLSVDAGEAERPVLPGVYLLLRGNHDEDYLQCLAVVSRLRAQGVPIVLQTIDARKPAK